MGSTAGSDSDSNGGEHIAHDECLRKGAQHVFRYVSRDAMKATICRERSEASPETDILLGFVCVPLSIIQGLDSDEDLFKIAKYTNIETRIIVYKMPGKVHEAAVSGLDDVIRRSLANSGMGEKFFSMRSTLAPEETTGKRQGPDLSYCYKFEPVNCPRIVCEVATTQTQPPGSLMEHAQFWGDLQDVRLLLTLTVRGNCETFHVCQWGAREGGALIKEGEIIVSGKDGNYAADSNSMDYLTTPFRQILKRDPNPESGEKDFVIVKDQIIEMAKVVDWACRTYRPTTDHHVKRAGGWGGWERT